MPRNTPQNKIPKIFLTSEPAGAYKGSPAGLKRAIDLHAARAILIKEFRKDFRLPRRIIALHLFTGKLQIPSNSNQRTSKNAFNSLEESLTSTFNSKSK